MLIPCIGLATNGSNVPKKLLINIVDSSRNVIAARTEPVENKFIL